jgi:hypothetical protein
LRIVAKMRNQAAPVLIGEPDDPEMIARKDSFPDCYGFNSLWEARNLCFDRNANPKDPAQLFFRVPLERHGRMMGVKDVTDGKKWDEPRYPIRGSRRHTVVDGNDVYDYSYVMIKQNARRFYVSTVYSYTQDAQFELHRFFGDNLVFVDHPLLSHEMCIDDEDRACKQEAFGNLLLLLSEKLRVEKA